MLNVCKTANLTLNWNFNSYIALAYFTLKHDGVYSSIASDVLYPSLTVQHSFITDLLHSSGAFVSCESTLVCRACVREVKLAKKQHGMVKCSKYSRPESLL